MKWKRLTRDDVKKVTTLLDKGMRPSDISPHYVEISRSSACVIKNILRLFREEDWQGLEEYKVRYKVAPLVYETISEITGNVAPDVVPEAQLSITEPVSNNDEVLVRIEAKLDEQNRILWELLKVWRGEA